MNITVAFSLATVKHFQCGAVELILVNIN